MPTRTAHLNRLICFLGSALLVASCASPTKQLPNANTTAETAARVRIAASSLEDTVVVDCQLPGQLKKLGGLQTYLTAGRLVRDTTIGCRTRGGEYTLGDLSGGTLSLKRWLPLAENGDPEAQYYVARIYANGMSGVPVDYSQAAHWYDLASKNGQKAAMQELGYLYEKGLGVAVDLQLALNLQRRASGLGDDLDYAWKISAAQQSAAKQIEELSARLETSNRDLEAARSELLSKQDALVRSRGDAQRAAATIAGLKSNLQVANLSGAAGNPAGTKELEAKLERQREDLRKAEEEQREAQKRIAALSADLGAQQAQLAASLAKSQATSLALNELTAARKSDSNSKEATLVELRARLAQSEDRLIRSQQELTEARHQFQREAQQLVDQQNEFRRALGKAGDGGAAVLQAKQREIDRQQQQLQALESQLALAKVQVAKAGADAAHASEADARTVALTKTVTELRARNAEAVEQLSAQKGQLAAIQANNSASAAQRDALVEQIKQQMRQQLATRDAQLASSQRNLESLEYETTQLKSTLKSMQTAGTASKVALDSEHQQALDLQDELDKARTEAARERLALVSVQMNLDQQRSVGQQNAQLIARLNADLKEKEAIVAAKDERIKALSQQTMLALRSAPARPAVPVAAVQLTPTGGADATGFMSISREFDVKHPGRNYALLIGNSNYRYMAKLKTPQNDVRELSRVLEQQYGFTVVTSEDATAREIMISLDSYVASLGENDHLLIYFAGHGDHDAGSAERAYWLGVDANPSSQDGYVEVENIQAKIKQMKAQHILLVADSCFSGAIAHGTSATIGRGINENRLRHELSHRARMVLASGGDTPVVDAGGDGDHSLFATYFIRTLRQNRTLLSGEMLAHELYEQIKDEAQRLHITQAPTYAHLSDANHDFGDFFFTPRAVLVADLN